MKSKTSMGKRGAFLRVARGRKGGGFLKEGKRELASEEKVVYSSRKRVQSSVPQGGNRFCPGGGRKVPSWKKKKTLSGGQSKKTFSHKWKASIEREKSLNKKQSE